MDAKAQEMADARRRAATLFARGHTRAEVARQLSVSRATTTDWYRRWRDGGRGALEAGRPLGAPLKLSGEALACVQRAIAGPPRAAGFELEVWSLAAISALIERETGIHYHSRHIHRVLKRLGWVVTPVGKKASLAFRQQLSEDPDGVCLQLREGWASVEPSDPE